MDTKSSIPFSALPPPAAEARRAVQHRLSIVPLKPRLKVPNVRRGIDDAITTRKEVWARAKKHPDDNYGIVLDGELFVVDIDGPAGRAALKAFERQHGELPATVETITPRGRHLYFRSRLGEPVPSSTGKLGDGIDVKGKRSHVVMAGSMHPTGKRYRYASGRALGEIEIAEAPRWLLKAVREPRRRVDRLPRSADAAARVRGVGRTTRYGMAALNSELDALRQTREGERNIALNKAGFKLAGLCAAGALDEATVRARLTETARKIGLEESEIAKTLDSAMGAGRRTPRDLAHLASSMGKPPVPEPAIDDLLAEELAALGETDADNAVRFARRHRETVAYVQDRGILTYEDGVWRPGGDTLALRLAEESARAIAGEAAHLNESTGKSGREAWSKHSLSKPALERMVGLAKGRLEVPSGAFDAHPWLLNVANGTFDLRTGRLRAHDPADRLTHQATVVYDPEARCPLFCRFLDESLAGDQEAIAFLQKAVGMSLTGDVSAQVLLYLKGCGRSGKSTIANLLRDLLGGYACHTGVETFTIKRHEPIPADLARLKGMRLVTAGEINHTQQFDEAKIKGMTGGDPITARHLYGQPFEYRPQFTLWLYANEFPKVRATDDAFWRRIRVIPFNSAVALKRVDPELPSKLLAEGSGILNWALAGCQAWQREGLDPPRTVLEATAEWRHGADHVRRYLRERTVAAAGARTAAAVLHTDFKSWCEDAGEKVLGMAGLKARLLELGNRTVKDKKGNFWLGLKLRD